MTKKTRARLGPDQEKALAALADPEDQRDPARLEEELGLSPGSLAAWLRHDPLFRRRLEVSLRPEEHLLTRAAVLKTLAAKAKEGSLRHQKYYLDLLESWARSEEDRRVVVKFVVSPAPAGR